MNIDSDDYGDANFVTGLIIQDIYPDNGAQYGGGHSVCPNEADLNTMGKKGGICRPDGKCDPPLECDPEDKTCKENKGSGSGSEFSTTVNEAEPNYNCFYIPDDTKCDLVKGNTKLFTTGTSCIPGTRDDSTMLYEISQLSDKIKKPLNDLTNQCQIPAKRPEGTKLINTKEKLEAIASDLGIEYDTSTDANALLKLIYEKQGKEQTNFAEGVANTWRQQVQIPTQWGSLLEATYGKKAKENVYTELRERKAGEIQMDIDKRMNEQVNRYHSLTDLVYQTQFSSEKNDAINGFLGKQHQKLKTDIKKASADVMSTDRQVQINHNNAEKVVLETKRLRLVFVATMVSIIIVCLGLLDIGVTFNISLVCVVIFYLFAFYLLSKSFKRGERNPNNSQELLFKPLTDSQLEQASSATEEVTDSGTVACTVIDKEVPAQDDCEKDHLCLSTSTEAEDNSGLCYHKDHPEAQKSNELRNKELRLASVEAQLDALKSHHDKTSGGEQDLTYHSPPTTG